MGPDRLGESEEICASGLPGRGWDFLKREELLVEIERDLARKHAVLDPWPSKN